VVGALVAVIAMLTLGAGVASAATLGQTGYDATSYCYGGDGTQWVQPNGSHVVPAGGGTITAMQYKSSGDGNFGAGDGPYDIDLNVLRPLGGDNYQVVGRTGVIIDNEDSAVHSVPVSIPVQAGDALGIWVGKDGFPCADNTKSGTMSVNIQDSAPAVGDVVNLPIDIPGQLNVAATLVPAGPEGPPGDPTCSDTADNDGDGQTDAADTDCQAAPPAADLCFGQPATITGNGVVNGTEGDDVIITGNGNDVVDGKGGNDRICTRGGDDHARGGAGNDRLNSGNGNDNTGGQSGNDIVQSTGGNDDVQGGDGMDHVQGGEGNDTLNGGNDADAVEGQGGNDLLAGNAGTPDYCDGGTGTDATPANGGCETIVGIP
jgi:Ca2+-binding RTX toxin-like protein